MDRLGFLVLKTGVRLYQAIIAHDEDSPYTDDDLRTPSIYHLRYVLRDLEKFSGKPNAGLGADIAECTQSDIGRLVQFPKGRSEQQHLRNIQETVLGIITRYDGPERRLAACFNLGFHLLEWHQASVKQPNQGKILSGFSIKYEWKPNNPELVAELAATVGIDAKELLPIGEAFESIPLKYADEMPEQRWLWDYAETGLMRLEQRILPDESGPSNADLAVPSQLVKASSDAAPPRPLSEVAVDLPAVPSSDQIKQLVLRLRVDVEELEAFLDGKRYRLPSEEAAYFVAALIDAQGDWQTPRDVTEKYPLFLGKRPGRIKITIPAPIRDLIETQDGKGSRIAWSKLLP